MKNACRCQHEACAAGAAMRGHSLVEVLMSGLVLAVAGVGLAGAIAQARPLTAESDDGYAAWNAIRSARAQIASVPFAEAGGLFQNSGFAVPSLQPVDGDADGLPGQILFYYGPGGDTSFYQVVLRVRWQGVTGRRTIEETFFLANVAGATDTPPPLEPAAEPPPEPSTEPIYVYTRHYGES